MTTALPNGLELVRTTDEFNSTSTPKGLLRAHRVATGVWGLLRVKQGTVTFVFEETAAKPAESILVSAGEDLVIPPQIAHHVAPDSEAVFCVEFHQ